MGPWIGQCNGMTSRVGMDARIGPHNGVAVHVGQGKILLHSVRELIGRRLPFSFGGEVSTTSLRIVRSCLNSL